jgi:hypothetical protein
MAIRRREPLPILASTAGFVTRFPTRRLQREPPLNGGSVFWAATTAVETGTGRGGAGRV